MFEGYSKNNLKIDMVRHGESRYQQPELYDAKIANDLTKEGISAIKETALKIANQIKPDEKVSIWSSPTGRTLQTAQIIHDVLAQKGVNFRHDGQIKVFETIGEIQNFSWDLFKPLIHGGEVNFNGEIFSIDKNESNPNNFSGSQFLKNNAWFNIAPEVLAKWPKEYVSKILSFEKYENIINRINKTMSRLENITAPNFHLIIITHDVLARIISASLTEGEIDSIDPGNFISLEKKGDKLIYVSF